MKKINLTLVLVAFFYLFVVSCSCNGNNDEKLTRKIEVTGSAEMEFTPNEIYMTFSLKEYLNSGKKVKLEDIKTEFLGKCKTAGIADSNISIAGYSGNERWDYYWYYKRKKEPEFMGSVSYSVKVSSAEKLDKLVASLNENAVENFRLTKTSHSDIEELRKQVKTNAMIASKNKAEYLAKSVGEEIGETILIQEIENSYRGGYYANESNYANVSQMATEDSNNESGSPNFQKIKLRYEIKAEYRLK